MRPSRTPSRDTAGGAAAPPGRRPSRRTRTSMPVRAATHGDPLRGAGRGWGCGLAFPGQGKCPAAAAPGQPAWSCPAHRGGPPAAGQQRPAVRPGPAGVVLSVDIGQALGESAISDPDDVHAADVPVSPVVAPAHDGACRAVGELLLNIESGLRRLREQLPPDPRTASRPWWRTPSGGGEVDSNTTSSVTRARTASRSWALRGGEAVHQIKDGISGRHAAIFPAVAQSRTVCARSRRYAPAAPWPARCRCSCGTGM